MQSRTQKSLPIETPADKDLLREDIQVKRYSGRTAQITDRDFYLWNRPAALAIAFVSPSLGFFETCQALKSAAGGTRLLAVSTAGELCSFGGDKASLYCTDSATPDNIILQLFSADILSDISVHAVPIYSEDIRNRNPVLSRIQRIEKIMKELESTVIPFPVSSQDTLALTFIDGLAASESYLMEAVYNSGRFPCLFVGGSAAKNAESKETYLFDGTEVLQNHAVFAFCKMAKGARFGAFKSQNFKLTDKSFVVIEVESEFRIVKTVIRSGATGLLPVVTALQQMMTCVPPEPLDKCLQGHTFGVVLNGEIFVNSIRKINEDGSVEFYCDVSPGDQLFLLEETDFIEQTSHDLVSFLQDKPPPIGAILNDCILRRINNSRKLAHLDSIWNFPTAGFSTFGELFGIPVSQTLSAVVFFKDGDGQIFHDKFMDEFPIHYASYVSYFNQRRSQQGAILNRMREEIIQRLTRFISESNRLNQNLGLLIDTVIIDEEKLLEEKKIYEKQFELVDDFVKINKVLSSIDKYFRIQYPLASGETDYQDPSGFLYETFHSSIVLGQRLRENIINLNRARHAALAAEKTLKLYTAKLESVNRELEDFTYIASHDMKEPLRGIHSFSQFLLDDYKDVLDEEGKKKLQTLQRLSTQLRDLIDNLLKYSRVGREEMTLKEVDINQVLHNTLESMDIDLKEKNGSVEVKGQLPVILCDPTLVGEVYRNLIMNALKYNESARKIIEIGATRTHEKMPGKLLFFVKDNGIGIPQVHLETIFKMFKRLHAPDAYGGGTGSGLPIVKKIIERHDGTIWAESDSKNGTVFYFTLSNEP
jgi:signal transduction histidine kinase